MSAAAMAMTDPLSLLHGHSGLYGGPGAVGPHVGGVSPSTDEYDDYSFEEDGEGEELYPTGGDSQSGSNEGSADDTKATKDGVKRRARRPPATAAKRATHNAVERARRESLNGRFLELAHNLPAMSTVKRPSKNAIVEKALEFVTSANGRESELVAQNTVLLTELNALRAQLGLSPRAVSASVEQRMMLSPTTSTSSRMSGSSAASSTFSDTKIQASSPVIAVGNGQQQQQQAQRQKQLQPVVVERKSASPRTVPGSAAEVFAQTYAPVSVPTGGANGNGHEHHHRVGNSASASTEHYLNALASFGWPQPQQQAQQQAHYQHQQVNDLFGPYSLDPSYAMHGYGPVSTPPQSQWQQYGGQQYAGLAHA